MIIKKNNSFLAKIELVGNKLPDISMLFLYALIFIWGLSFVLSFVNFNYFHPTTKEQIIIINMLAPQELLLLLTNMVKNYALFPPLAMTVIVTIGVGIAEGSGFLTTAVKKGMRITSQKWITPTVAFVSILSNLISDSAYVILMPLASLIFYLAGKHPLAGIAASFAALAGGFSASYIPSPMDPIMQGFTQSAVNLLDKSYIINVLCNYFFSVTSTFAVIGVVWFITDKIIEPKLFATMPIELSKEDQIDLESHNIISDLETKAFKITIIVIGILAILLFFALFPENSIFRAVDGSLTSSKAPIMQSIVPIIFLFFAIPGLVFGSIMGIFKTSKDVSKSMGKTILTLSGFFVFSFFCSQFLYVFGKSNIGTLIAISGAELLKSLNMPPQITIVGLISLTSVLNLIITSASSKWAILAPIFVPMLMGVNIAPELTQAAFRLSDAAVNVSTPMFAFYPLIISYCQKYCKQTGVGTLCSMMIPYTIGLLIVLTSMLFLFWGLGIPLGIDSNYIYMPK